MDRLLLIFLAIEFLDELVYGAREAAWPLIRSELGISYLQIGLLISLPLLVGSLVEPVVGVLGDIHSRRRLIQAGGVVFAGALFVIALSGGFPMLLAAFVLLSPASGAFVSLSQASLMDAAPARREHNMARWTLAGSLGVVLGPLAVVAFASLGLGWRGLFLGGGALALGLVALAWRRLSPMVARDLHIRRPGGESFTQGLWAAVRALRRREVQRWLILLEFSDLMLDVLYGYLALYFVDVVGVTPVQASLAVAVWTGFGLLGDVALIPLLERVAGLFYLRVSALVELALYLAFLLVPTLWAKLIVVGLLGFFNAGWYSILKAQLYAAMPDQSGRVMTVGNLSGLVGGLIPLGLGWVAQGYGLESAMWLLLLGPVALTLGLPHRGNLRRDG